MSKSLLPGELTEFFIDHRSTFNKEAICIAEDDLTEVEVWLTERAGYPYFEVTCDGETLYEASSTSISDALETYRAILALYIPDDYTELVDAKKGSFPVEGSCSNKKDDGDIDTLIYDEDDPDSLLSDEQFAKSDKIFMAVWDMLDAMLDNCAEDLGISPEDMTDVAHVVEQFLHDNYGVAVVHPTVIELEDGTWYVEEYPWDPDWQEKE